MTTFLTPKGPVSPAPTLPELVAVTCPECQGAKFHERITSLGVDHSRRCETCFGAGEVEVCSGCGERPTIICGVEACGCTFPGTHLDPDTAHLIAQAEAAAKLCREFLERLERKAEMVDPEVAWAREYTDWLSPAQVGL